MSSEFIMINTPPHTQPTTPSTHHTASYGSGLTPNVGNPAQLTSRGFIPTPGNIRATDDMYETDITTLSLRDQGSGPARALTSLCVGSEHWAYLIAETQDMCLVESQDICLVETQDMCCVES